jgi:hypothetical protein
MKDKDDLEERNSSICRRILFGRMERKMKEMREEKIEKSQFCYGRYSGGNRKEKEVIVLSKSCFVCFSFNLFQCPRILTKKSKKNSDVSESCFSCFPRALGHVAFVIKLIS